MKDYKIRVGYCAYKVIEFSAENEDLAYQEIQNITYNLEPDEFETLFGHGNISAEIIEN